MSLPPGPSPSPVTNEPPPAEPSSDIPMWLVLALVGVLVAALGLTGFVLLDQRQDKQEAAASYPDSWDPRVAEFVQIAEKERGLTFMHPVAVRFLPKAEFEKGIRTDEDEQKLEDRELLDQTAGLMRAIGLLSGDVDLFAALNDAHGSGTLAYYSFEDQRVTIRGEKVTPSIRSTLVHELTHALQDQHFAIGDRMEKLREEGLNSSTTESSVLEAIVEGDAKRVETLYRESLPAKQRAALDRGQQRDAEKADAELKKVPKVILTLISSPYALGEAMMQAVADNGGNADVDALFREPPQHDSVLLDPFQVLSHETGAKKVALPELESGEKKFASGEFGAMTWYFMLAERLPVTEALDVVDGWGGDAYVGFERDGRSCMRAAYVGDTGDDTAHMLGALERWSGGSSTATVTRDGRGVLVESCDPGAKAATVKDTSEDALTLAAVRAYLGINIKKAGAQREQARCIADRLVHEYPASQLTDPSSGPGTAAMRARVQQLAVACR